MSCLFHQLQDWAMALCYSGCTLISKIFKVFSNLCTYLTFDGNLIMSHMQLGKLTSCNPEKMCLSANMAYTLSVNGLHVMVKPTHPLIGTDTCCVYNRCKQPGTTHAHSVVHAGTMNSLSADQD